MLRLSMTFETLSEESVVNGDTEDTGFVFENVPHTARELARYITRHGFTEPSDSHGTPQWLTCYGEADYRTGVTESRNLHPGRDTQSQKVWAKVLRICNVTRAEQV